MPRGVERGVFVPLAAVAQNRYYGLVWSELELPRKVHGAAHVQRGAGPHPEAFVAEQVIRHFNRFAVGAAKRAVEVGPRHGKVGRFARDANAVDEARPRALKKPHFDGALEPRPRRVYDVAAHAALRRAL